MKDIITNNKRGGPRKGSGRKPIAVKKRAYLLYFYESEVNELGGWELLRAALHKTFEQLKKKNIKNV